MSINKVAFATVSVAILSAGAASAATCNQGRVTGTEMCQISKSAAVRQDAEVRSEKSFGAGKFALVRKGKANKKMRRMKVKNGMYSQMLSSTAEARELRRAAKSGSTVKQTPAEIVENAESVASEVPLPAAGFLLLAGLGGLAVARRKR